VCVAEKVRRGGKRWLADGLVLDIAGLARRNDDITGGKDDRDLCMFCADQWRANDGTARATFSRNFLADR
jgi:hypothetical protein